MKIQPIQSARLFSTIIILALTFSTLGVSPARAAGNGPLDPTFDSDGLVTTAVGTNFEEARAIAIQADGKIVVAGTLSNLGGSPDFALVRYNSDGTLDITFDMDGKANTDFGDQEVARAIAIQNDGKIVLAGYSTPDNVEAAFALARYNTDGTLDTSFDTDGKLLTNLGNGYDYASDVAIQEDGKIVVVGNKYIGINNDDIALVRYNADGSLDTSFDTDGIVTLAIGSGYEYGTSIAIQTDGKIIIGGGSSNPGNQIDFALVRFNTDGSLDGSFDTDGIVTLDFNNDFDRGGSIALQGDGKIIIAGYDDNGNALLARYNNNGSLNTSFDVDGKAINYIDNEFTLRDIAIQPNGKLVLVGYDLYGLPYVNDNFAIVRYNSNGSLDTSFDTDGKVFTDFGDNQDDLANSVAIQPDGKIIAAGYRYIGGSNYDFALARYVGDTVNIHYVTPVASGTGDCSNWENACTLQTALTGATGGDEIWVAAGTYKPTTDTDRYVSFQLKTSVAVYGGFSGMETARDQRNPAANLTVLSGELGITSSSDNSYHVVIGASGATLDGFTITRGNANDSVAPNNRGGGMYNSGSSPMLTNLIFSNNSATDSGGGMHNASGSNPTLMNVTFSDNYSSEDGGGMSNYSSHPTLTNVTFSANGGYQGGGMTNSYGSHPTLTNVTFSDNSASYGGGMFNYGSGSNPTLTNVTFSGNTYGDGAGMYNYSSNPTLTNVTFSGNDGALGGGMANTAASSPILTNVTFNGNSANMGGGISNDSGCSPILVNVTFSDNTVVYSGGGMYNYTFSSPTLTNVTFSSNSTTDPSSHGGGMYNYTYSSPTLTNVTFNGNSAGMDGGGVFNYNNSNPQIRNTLFWGNTAPSGAQIYNDTSAPIVNDSVVQGGCPVGSTCTNIITGDPLLDTLGNYGGSTQTIPLLSGSSAINTGNDAVCPAADQRGVSRPQGAHCDIGAYEFEGVQKSTLADFNGDGTTDVSIFRPSTGQWFVKDQFAANWGVSTDIPTPGDYNGDGKTDVAIYRPTTGQWFVKDQFAANWGVSTDIPVPGDYNGDGKADVAIYRPSTGQWFVKDQFAANWGVSSDIPVPGDYNGDGKTDVAIYRPSTGQWFVKDQFAANWGLSTDIPVPGDYNGDGKTDIAVYRPSTGQWFVKDQFAATWGVSSDIPVPSDYNGDGKADIAIYRPSTGQWFVKDQFAANWGVSTDFPLPAPDTNGDGDPYQ